MKIGRIPAKYGCVLHEQILVVVRQYDTVTLAFNYGMSELVAHPNDVEVAPVSLEIRAVELSDEEAEAEIAKSAAS